ncbi:MAG: DUF58 domain-containing protein [Verrucomicrobiales bacterium]|nr:DUF58 domain-containing protein [Verrucomicrobiales bacterium]
MADPFPLDDPDERLKRILQRVRRIELLTRGLIKENLGGAYHSRFKGQGIEFDDFREYQPGDDVRFLDWNVTARMNEPFVRKYVEERELNVLLLVDVSGSGDYGSVEDSKRERMAEVAAVFALSAAHNGDKVGLALFSNEVEHYLPPRKGHGQMLRLIRDILNHAALQRGTDLAPALDLALNRISHRALVVVVSDFLTPVAMWRKAMRSLAAKHDVVAVQVLDPAELELPRAGRVTLEDPESGEQFVLNTSSTRVREKYEERLQEMLDEVSHELKKNGVERVTVRMDQDYAPALTAYFRSRRRRKRA